MSDQLSTQTPRSRQMLLQALQYQQDPVRSGNPLEGIANAGKQILNAYMVKQLMNKDDAVDFSKDAATKALIGGDVQQPAMNTVTLPKNEDGSFNIDAKPVTTQVRPQQSLMSDRTREGLMSVALDPKAVLLDRAQRQKPNYMDVSGVGLVNTNTQGGPKTIIPVTPKPAEGFKPGSTRQVGRGSSEVTQEFDGKTWNDIGTAPKFNPKDSPETFTPLTEDQAKGLGLNPSGTYQRSSKGKIDVVTQPKQDSPTESQQKYKYNAGRVSDALTAVGDILKKDPSAVSNWALSASNGIPGLDSLGRKYTNPNAQVVRNNLGDAIDAIITLGTGAAYTKEQLQAAQNSLLPQPGESGQVLGDKFRKMQSLYSLARENARSAGNDLPDPSVFNSIYQVPKEAAAPMAPPQAGNGRTGIVQWERGPDGKPRQVPAL